MSDCPYCATQPPPRSLTLQQTTDGVYHTHNCPAVKREMEGFRAWRIEIGDPYYASDPGAHERYMRYLRKMKLVQ
jgi:hypothetical protein